MISIDDRMAADHGIHGHQQSYFNTFLQLFDIRGKDILEIGGAMPSQLVLGHLGAKSWTAVQSATYAEHRSDNQVPTPGLEYGTRYRAVYENIENLTGNIDFTECYDAIFSIACFEHIHKLPQALNAMKLALRRGGCLFTMFAPIWSGPWGQHHTDPVPPRFDALMPSGGWTTQHIFSPWDHLLLSRTQFFQKYSSKFDQEYAEELTYITYNSPQINRLFFEDYEFFISTCGLDRIIFQGVFEMPDTDMSQHYINELLKHYDNFGYKNFRNAGIIALLKKP